MFIPAWITALFACVFSLAGLGASLNQGTRLICCDTGEVFAPVVFAAGHCPCCEETSPRFAAGLQESCCTVKITSSEFAPVGILVFPASEQIGVLSATAPRVWFPTLRVVPPLLWPRSFAPPRAPPRFFAPPRAPPFGK